MMNKMNEMMVSLMVKSRHALSNEKGAQALEWLGLAALLIMVLGIVSTALSGGQDKITGVIDKIFSNIGDQLK